MGFHHGKCLKTLYNRFGGVTESMVISSTWKVVRAGTAIQRTFFTAWESISKRTFFVCNFVL